MFMNVSICEKWQQQQQQQQKPNYKENDEETMAKKNENDINAFPLRRCFSFISFFYPFSCWWQLSDVDGATMTANESLSKFTTKPCAAHCCRLWSKPDPQRLQFDKSILSNCCVCSSFLWQSVVDLRACVIIVCFYHQQQCTAHSRQSRRENK